MTVSPFDSQIHGRLFADDEIAALFSDEAALRTMVAFEVVLARVQARLGIVPQEAADRRPFTRIFPAPRARHGTPDAEETGMYNTDSGQWEPISADYQASVRQGIRMARQQATQDMFSIPVPGAEVAQ